MGYVSDPGQWAQAPAAACEVVDKLLTADDRANRTILVYGPGSVVTVPQETAVKASKKDPKATRLATDTCAGGAFCLCVDADYGGRKGTWADTSVWQTLSNWDFADKASSMSNNRGGWSLLENSTGGRYCAKPNSKDSTLVNNGYNNNTRRIYLSTATSKNSGWGCAN